MNGVRIYVSNDINSTDTILNGEVIDLFKDENIQMTLKQTDIRDIAQNYTDYTQGFTVPASPKNNRIFRYWYDSNNDNQWESVSGIPCRIDIGGVFFKKGTLKINSAQIDENGNIKHYAVEFTANLKALKDKFNDTKLEQLNYLNVIPLLDSSGNKTNEFNYTDTTVYNYITATSSQWLEFPLISTKRLIDNFNTIKYVNSATLTGITKSELRPAMQCKKIFEAIEDNYNVKFTGDFYDLNSPLDNMYLWLNKNEDVVTNVAQVVGITGSISGSASTAIQFMNTTDPNPMNHYMTLTRNHQFVYRFGVGMTLATSTPTVPYKIFIQTLVLNPDGTINEIATKNQENEGYVGSTDYLFGNNSFGFNINVTGAIVGAKAGFRFAVESVGSLIVTGYTITGAVMRYAPFSMDRKILTNTTGFSMIPRFNINRSLPEMTVQDFFTSIIKMFNIVLVPISDPIKLSQLQTNDAYQLEYYKDYYGKVDEVDITAYTNKAIKINKVKNFKKITFKHADSNYGTNIMYKKAQNPTREYGSLVSQPSFKTDEGDYSIESKFNVMIWRELPNTYAIDDDYQLNQTWLIADGLNEDFDKGVFNKPTIFFSNGMSNITDTSKRIGFVRESATTSPIQNYNIFSNVDSLDILNYKTSITFSRENEFQSPQGFFTDRNLFSTNYSDLISGLYSPYAREYEVKAILPKHIYTKLNLGSQIIIRNQRFNIVDVNINLINGESKLKLSNVIEESNIVETDAGFSAFGIDTISSTYYAGGGFTEKEIKIKYPINAAKLKWRANYSISTTGSGYKVSFTTQAASGFGGLLWYDFYDSSTVGNHVTSINQLLPVGGYPYDTAASYASPITGYLRAKTGNTLSITIIAYDDNDVALAQTTVTV